jgi:hypothetical protein
MSGRSAKGSKVQLGGTLVASINDWEGGEIARALADASEFEDDFDTFDLGPISGGSVVCSGFYNPDDASGQEALRTAQINGTAITNLRLYFGDLHTTDFLTLVEDGEAYVEHISPIAASRKAGKLMPVSFTLRISGGVLQKAKAILTASTIAFVEGGASKDTITDSGSGLVTAGFTQGMGLIAEGSPLNSKRTFTIDTGGVAAGALTLITANDVTAENAGVPITLIGFTKYVYA